MSCPFQGPAQRQAATGRRGYSAFVLAIVTACVLANVLAIVGVHASAYANASSSVSVNAICFAFASVSVYAAAIVNAYADALDAFQATTGCCVNANAFVLAFADA